MIQACSGVRERWSASDGAYIGGIHFYGPYFAEDQPVYDWRD
jgi:N-acetylglucosamine-6-phosphate deacetylase